MDKTSPRPGSRCRDVVRSPSSKTIESVKKFTQRSRAQPSPDRREPHSTYAAFGLRLTVRRSSSSEA